MSQLYDRYLGVQWEERPPITASGKRGGFPTPSCAYAWPPRERLVVFARAAEMRLEAGLPPSRLPVPMKCSILNRDHRFRRRFATYKRGTLIPQPGCLAAIVNDKDRPVQIIFAGKAHPARHGGRADRRDHQVCRRPEFHRRIVFIEDLTLTSPATWFREWTFGSTIPPAA